MYSLSHDMSPNIPKMDFLSLLEKGEPRASKVIEFLGFKKDDISKAAGIPLSSVRFDERIPQIFKDKLREWANLINLVAQFFEGDAIKTALWFQTANPILGDIPPRDMIRFGRSQKMLKFILNVLSENQS